MKKTITIALLILLSIRLVVCTKSDATLTGGWTIKLDENDKYLNNIEKVEKNFLYRATQFNKTHNKKRNNRKEYKAWEFFHFNI